MTLWAVAHQAPLFEEFSGQECFSGLPFPSPGDLLDPGIEPLSPTLRADFYCRSHQGSLWNYGVPNSRAFQLERFSHIQSDKTSIVLSSALIPSLYTQRLHLRMAET